MTTSNFPQTFCDFCHRDIKIGEQYYRLDALVKGKVTRFGDRQLKHCCSDCLSLKFRKNFKKIED